MTKQRKTEKEIKEEILNMSRVEIEINTKYIIHFEDFGQDFLEWHIDERGYVLDSRPFQRSIWAGRFTIPETAKVGEKLAIWLDGQSYVNYPIKSIEVKNKEKKPTFVCKECGTELEFDSFGNFKCKTCKIVSKDKSLIRVKKK